MDINEWLEKLSWLSADQKVQVHFELQEQIKAHYKLRAEGDHLERAIQLCEQSVAFAPLAFKALKEKWERDFPGQEFFVPAHHGYRQLITIMKKRKDMSRVKELQAKRDAEGWDE
ncbi:hypothetical protein ACTW2I_001619 [Cronobacter sakazakii]|uniref:hypothetical protein n=1 Tax=Cronobacter sakazakii TaxID=28141 RepID=UPI0009BB4172|nr:hypothetical protein [Cronobacter sakazakii]ELY2932146.1 hypothetical protein [Cronobacter sakazakii]PUX69154.1 hypothetical protein BS420_04675 [Cronobacter sakazakii]